MNPIHQSVRDHLLQAAIIVGRTDDRAEAVREIILRTIGLIDEIERGVPTVDHRTGAPQTAEIICLDSARTLRLAEG